MRKGLSYFINPAAVSARVITAPTSMPRRRGSRCGVGRGCKVVSGHNTLERSGVDRCAGAEIGDTCGISFALGESTTGIFAAAALRSLIQAVRPKNFAISPEEE